MNRRDVGLALVAIGALTVLVGLIGALTSGDDSAPATSLTTTTSSSTSTTAVPTTTTTSMAATTTTGAATTTTVAVTTTTVDAASAIEAFVMRFVDAIAARDVDFLHGSLHPAVIGQYGDDLCRSFIEEEILDLVDYRLTGEVTGPVRKELGGSSIDTYEAPVSFDFQGESFDAMSSFAIDGGEVRWFAECR